jgi:hypothetical protein
MKPEKPPIRQFTITLFDKSGFKIGEIIIDSFMRKWNSDTKKAEGYSAYGKVDWSNIDSFETIKDYRVSVILE